MYPRDILRVQNFLNQFYHDELNIRAVVADDDDDDNNNNAWSAIPVLF